MSGIESQGRANIYRSLALLEDEYAEGELTKEDFEKLRAKYTTMLAEDEVHTIPDEPIIVPDTKVVGQATKKRSRYLSIAIVILIALLAGIAIAFGTRDRTSGQTTTGDVAETESRLILQAQQLVSDGKTTDALKIYDKVLAANPENAEALSNKGWLLYLAGRAAKREAITAEGTRLIDKAIRVEPSAPTAHFFRAQIYVNDGQKKSAIAEYNKFLASDPPKQIADAIKARRDALK